MKKQKKCMYISLCVKKFDLSSNEVRVRSVGKFNCQKSTSGKTK